MIKKVYAFIVGINDYPNPKHKLNGAVPDTGKIVSFLKESFPEEKLELKLLLNSEATYQNFIDSFRQHLGKATEEDIVWFHYSGHGARQPTASELEPYTSGNMDETLVLYDSRPDGKDLADRELGILISEIEKSGAHILVTLDCCHSGSGTRDINDIAPTYTERLTENRNDKRALGSYLDGYYVKNGFQFPNPKHILLAACNRFQTAKETYTSSGVFTDNLVKTLKNTGIEISYADLFVRMRQGVISNNIPDQDPQLELMGGTNGFGQFLNGSTLGVIKKIPIYKLGRDWVMGAGAIQGLQNAVEMNTQISIYHDEEKDPFTTASISSVSFQKSILRPNAELNEDEKYWGIPNSFPYPAEKIYFEKEIDAIPEYVAQLEVYSGMSKATDNEKNISSYALKLNSNEIELWDLNSSILMQRANIDDKDGAIKLFLILNQTIVWKRIFALQNPSTKINVAEVSTYMEIEEIGGRKMKYEPGNIQFGDKSLKYPYQISIHNLLKQSLHYCLLYLSEDFGVTVLKNEPIEYSEKPTLFWGGGKEDFFFLEQGQEKSNDTFLLIVSTERTDDFELVMDGFQIGDSVSVITHRGVAGISKFTPLKGEWFTQKFNVKIG